MNIAERDAYIVDRLAALAQQGITGQQAVNELVRTAGVANIVLPEHDAVALVADVAGLQVAATALTVPTTRTDTAAAVVAARGKVPRTAQSDSWRQRVVIAGK